MKTGIESISMYIPRFGLDLRDLAKARNVDVSKFTRGIGQEFMAVPAPDEDVVTLGANAALQALEGVDRSAIRTVIFATESGIDQSKAAAIYVHKLLDLPQNCRTVEMKQACCSSTSALHFALATVALHPEQKVLLVASDIARYGLGSPGEPTQGGGAVAMVISAQPKIMAMGPNVGYYTEDVMDFWRPNYMDEAMVDGKYSIKVYLHALEETWKDYQAQGQTEFASFEHFCYHLPFSRMGLKAHLHLARLEKSGLSASALQAQVEPSLAYNRRIGNAYTASLYVGLLSLLETHPESLEGNRVGFFSYGSGCMGAFFGGTILPGYRKALPTRIHRELLTNRQRLTLEEYEEFYNHALPRDGQCYRTDRHRTGAFRLAGLENHQRIYEKVPQVKILAADAANACAAAPVM
ncbi:MAG: hydroxymethylglutaryl-CoA synthase [Verrucomicrobia bacterium]|nr:hydroxymethylglutaryl-CoA synthase [Verrucomicrobiota bacterium]MCH8511853.1 hydroxymethylglutaryl-CoA synthase [Kiritimatiellia bacterium]